MAIHTRLIKIGNSQGIRIPKAVLEQVDLSGEVELRVEENRLIIQPAPRPRQGWEASFTGAQKTKEDWKDWELTNRFDDEEWTW